MTIWRMRITCWITKATDTNSEYTTLIAYSLQKWLHERASLLRYVYIDSPVLIIEFCQFNTSDKECGVVSWLPSDIFMNYDKNTPKTRHD